MVLFSGVSVTSTSVCYPSCPLFIVIASPVVWAGSAVGWDSGDVVAGALIRVDISDCVCSNTFSAFT